LAGYRIWPFKDIFPENTSSETVSEEETPDYEQYLAIGFSREQIDRMLTTIEEQKDILKSHPESFSPYLKISNIYVILEEYQKAEEFLLEVIEIGPTFAPAYASLGELYGSFMNKKVEAVESYKKAIELTPWRSEYYHSLADLYRSNFPEKEKEIESMFLSGVEQYPRTIGFYTYLASYFWQKNDLTKAIHYTKTAIKIEPDNEILKQELAELERKVYGQ